METDGFWINDFFLLSCNKVFYNYHVMLLIFNRKEKYINLNVFESQKISVS
jgi:hypothetical protein